MAFLIVPVAFLLTVACGRDTKVTEAGEPIEVLRTFYEAIVQSDSQTFNSLLAPNVSPPVREGLTFALDEMRGASEPQKTAMREKLSISNARTREVDANTVELDVVFRDGVSTVQLRKLNGRWLISHVK
jgi:hypothetical protein